MGLPRFVHRVRAFAGGYFWLPCPQCGRPFGGHEVRGPAYEGPRVVMFNVAGADGTVGGHRIVCPDCAPIVAAREFRDFLAPP
jgi:hypothetical protein